MSPDLLNRPDSEEDGLSAPDQKPYDNEFEAMLKRGQLGEDPEEKLGSTNPEDSSSAPSATDDDLPSNHPSRSKSPEELNAAEQQGSSAPIDSPAQTEASNLGKSGFFNTDADSEASIPQRIKAKVTRKRAIVGGGGIAAAITTVGLFSFLQGPLQFIHLAQTLERLHLSFPVDFGDDRSSRVIVSAVRGNQARGRLGYTGNFVADKWEKRMLEKTGVRSLYDKTTGRLVGYEIMDEKKAAASGLLDEAEKNGVKTVDSMPNVKTAGKVAQPPDLGKNRSLDLRDEKYRKRRVINKLASKATGTNRIVSEVGSRLLKKRGGVVFHPLNRVKKFGDDLLLERRRIRESRDKGLETGEPPEPITPTEGDATPGEGGLPGEGTPGIPGETPEVLSPFEEVVAKIKDIAGKATVPLAVVATVCTVKQFSGSIDNQQIENEKQLVRLAMGAITVGSQVMTNQDLDMVTLSALSQDFYDPGTKTSWLQDPRLEKEMGKDATSADPLADNDPSNAKEKPLLFQIVEQFPTSISVPIPGIPDLDACVIIDVPAEAINQIPGASQVTDFAQGIIDSILDGVFHKTSEQFIQMAIDYFAGGAVDLAARGAKRGALLNVGARKAANEQFISNGGRELTPAEADEAKTVVAQSQAEEFAHASSYQKYLNPYDDRSVISQFIDQAPTDKREVLNNIAKLPSMFASMSANLFTGGRASAKASASDYAFPLYGYSEAERDDPAYADPYENEDTLLDTLKTVHDAEEACAANARKAHQNPYPQCEKGYSSLKELNTGDSDFTSGDGDGDGGVGSDFVANGQKCFGMQIKDTVIDPTKNSLELIYGESPAQKDIPSDCGTIQNQVFIRYRFYLADSVSVLSAACYEGEKDSCQQVGLGDQGTSTSAPTTGDARGQDTSGQSCSVGTDGGIGITPVDNIKIRLCVVDGITVNVAIEKNVDAAVKGAATAGLTLGAESAYRSYTEQIALRKQNCGDSDFDIYQKPAGQCSPPTAIPGTSLHEWGLAVDFTCNGSTMSAHGTCFEWLENNQAAHQLKNLPSEPWHWSSTGN